MKRDNKETQMKRKVNLNRPGISSEEIAQRKDFNSVLKNSSPNAASKPLFKKPWFLSSIAVATLAIITTAVLLNQKNKPIAEKPVVTEAPADSSKLEAFYKAEEAKPCIAPPIKGLNVPYTVFSVDAAKGGSVDVKSGSQFIVPKNAFVDANGNVVKGTVELRYREFHDAADFFVAGIPMTYDSAGVKYQFESAGMMEMLAYQNGKQVSMALGKTVEVKLASDYSGSEYDLYELDTVRNNWSCLGKDKVVAQAPKLQKSDTSGVQSVQQTPQYKKTEEQKVEAQAKKEQQIAALPAVPVEPKKPVKADPKKIIENLDVSYDQFPELKPFKGVEWQVGDENKDFTEATHRMITDPKMYWSDVEIKEGPKKNENYIITLSKGAKKYSYIYYPVLEGKGYETAMKEFGERFAKYTATLDQRKADEKRIEDEFQAKIKALKAQQAELERQWKQEMNRHIAVMTTQEKVMRIFSISKFGVYNCDNPSAYPHGVSCTAKLANSNGAALMCYDVYLVDKKKNGLFTYYRNPLPVFTFDPASSNILWTVEEGKLYYLSPEQFSDIKGGEQTLRLTRVEQDFKTVDELKAFFNL